MSTKHPTLTRATHGSGPAKSWPPFLRRACALLVSVTAATLGACADAPTGLVDAPSKAPAAAERLSQVAKAMASAMHSADVRLDVLKAMRASPRVDHSLILADYLAEPRAAGLLEGGAAALSLTSEEFMAMVRGLPELEFVVPFAGHRRSWTGTSRIAVGTYWDPDVPVFTNLRTLGLLATGERC